MYKVGDLVKVNSYKPGSKKPPWWISAMESMEDKVYKIETMSTDGSTKYVRLNGWWFITDNITLVTSECHLLSDELFTI